MSNKLTNKLSNKDYINILKFYKMNIPKSRQLLKIQAEKIMAEKLCKCIKKLDTEFEEKSIAICSKTIFNNKKLKRGQFSCKGKQSVKIMKNIASKSRKKSK
jgi:hypothetical protein